jgi:hypothetical protein
MEIRNCDGEEGKKIKLFCGREMGGYRSWLGLANQPTPIPCVGRVWKEIELVRLRSLGLATSFSLG